MEIFPCEALNGKTKKMLTAKRQAISIRTLYG